MKKYSVLISLMILLIILGCDRFEHDFYTPPVAHINSSANVGYTPLEVAFFDVSDSGSDPIEEWTWDLDGDGIPEHIFTPTTNPDSVVFTYINPATYTAILTIDDGRTISTDTTYVEVLDASSPLADFDYDQPDYDQLLINFTDTSTPGTNPIVSWEWDFNNDDITDSSDQNPTYTFPDYGDFEVSLLVSDGTYENTITKTISVIGRSVLVELFTGRWCQNCPKAEEALHNLETIYGSRFSYVEYHWNDELETDFAFDLFQYYPNAAGFPFGVINGNAGFIYATPSVEEIQAAVQEVIAPLLQQEPQVTYENVQTNLLGTNLTGSVEIALNNIPTENLNLVVVLMQDFNAEYPNFHGDPHHNIALKRELVDISAIDLDNPVEFSINDLNIMPDWYNGVLPENISLVLWVQTIELPYNETTCSVHNVIEIEIVR